MSEQKNQSLTSSEATDRLESWKEIAGYLGREVRTVQGWEKTEGLPIHRHQHARQGSVFAFKPELDAWREGRKVSADAPPVENNASGEPPQVRGGGKTLLVAGIALALVAAAVAGWRLQRPKQEAISSIVVLPFKDFSP